MRATAAPASAPGVGDRVTVGAQQPQVLAPVVTPVPVDVIDLQGHGLAEPLGADPAFGAHLWCTYLQERPTQQVGSRSATAVVLDEDVLGAPKKHTA
jgi:hypothetical protein